MGENTVFTTPVQGGSIPTAQPIQAVPLVPQVSSSPVLSSQGESLSRPPVLDEGGGGFPFGKILKIVIGALLVVILVFVAIVVVLPKIQNSGEKEAVITYWGLWENENVMKGIIADFQRQNPKIKVIYEKQNIKEYRERVTTRIANGTGPDMFMIHNSWVPMFAGLLTPVPSSVVKSEEFQNAYYPVVQRDLMRNGAIYGIPAGIDTLSMYVNKDIFAAAGIEVPTMWDDFANVARKLTVKDEQGRIKTAGAALGTFDNINHAPDIISLLFLQNGADLRNLSVTNQNASDALSFYTSFARDSGSVWDETLDPSLLMFTQGNLAMYFGYSWDFFVIKASNPNLPFDIHPVPHLQGKEMTIASYWVNSVPIKSKYQKETMLFMKYLAKMETQQKLFADASKTRFFGFPYARLDMASLLKDNQYVYPFIAQAKNASSSFFASDTYDNGLNAQSNVYLGNAVRGILNGDSAQTAVDTLSQGVSQILQRYGQQ